MELKQKKNAPNAEVIWFTQEDVNNVIIADGVNVINII